MSRGVVRQGGSTHLPTLVRTRGAGALELLQCRLKVRRVLGPFVEPAHITAVLIEYLLRQLADFRGRGRGLVVASVVATAQRVDDVLPRGVAHVHDLAQEVVLKANEAKPSEMQQ